MLYINEVVGTYSYFVKTVCWANEFQVVEKSYNIRPWSYIRDFFPCIRPWSYKRVVLCSGKTGTATAFLAIPHPLFFFTGTTSRISESNRRAEGRRVFTLETLPSGADPCCLQGCSSVSVVGRRVPTAISPRLGGQSRRAHGQYHLGPTRAKCSADTAPAASLLQWVLA